MKTSPDPRARSGPEGASVSAVQAALRDGALTVRQLVQACLDRIAAYDQAGPRINSIIRINPEALAEADRLDAQLAAPEPGTQAGSRKLLPLYGVPVLVKDNIETEGLATSAGSPLLEAHVPQEDAFIVRKLREAGAIVLAKTNLHEFANGGETVSTLMGQTLNPYDLRRTPGGSSGGTAAGLAAGFGLLGLGTDTVNSIRSPASACNLVGLRPTMGLVSRAGLIPCGLTHDIIGPITRTVADAAIMMDAMAGHDSADPSTREAGAHIPPGSYTAFLDQGGLQGARIGVLKRFFGNRPEHQAVNAVIQEALAILEGQGAILVGIDDPLDPEELLASTMAHQYEMARDMEAFLAKLPPAIRARSLEGMLASGQVHPSVAGAFRTALALASQQAEYRARLQRQSVLRHRLLDLMARHQLEVLAFPHQRRLVVPVGETQAERNGVLATATGFPAIVIPAGFSTPDTEAPQGVPIGIEFLGRPFSEPILFRLTHAAEQALPARKNPHTTPAPARSGHR